MSIKEKVELDLNNTDFLIWDKPSLAIYQRELIGIIASLESQIDRNNVRMQHFDLISELAAEKPDFAQVFDERWRKNVTYSLSRARLFLAEVTRRLSAIEQGRAPNP
jgi:hypothetical protein